MSTCTSSGVDGDSAQVGNLCYGDTARGCPCTESRRRWSSEAMMAKREQYRVSAGQDARSERPATGHGQPRAAHHNEPAASRPVGFEGVPRSMRVGKAHRLKTCATRNHAARGCPCTESRRRWSSEAMMAKREQHRVSAGQDARSERPATGHGQPRAAHHNQPAASRPVGFHGAESKRVRKAHRLKTCATGTQRGAARAPRACHQALSRGGSSQACWPS